MEDTRVRACIKCKSYIILFPNDPENQKRLKNFEKAHKSHNLITIDIEEVKGGYINIASKK